MVDTAELAIDFGFLEASDGSNDVSSSSSSKCNRIQKQRSEVGGRRRWKPVSFEDAVVVYR